MLNQLLSRGIVITWWQQTPYYHQRHHHIIIIAAIIILSCVTSTKCNIEWNTSMMVAKAST